MIGIIAGCDFSGALSYDFHTDDVQDDNGIFYKYILEQGIERIRGEQQMADIAIIYQSVHHGNTKKMVEKIQEALDVDLYPVTQIEITDFSKYRGIGFASGIYMSKMHPSLFDFLKKENKLPRQAFILYTSGSGGKNYAKKYVETLKKKGIETIGVFECRGYDTYGPLKWIGGIAKNHPDEKDLKRAIEFIEDMKEKLC